jgi:hypothetical protein
MVCLEKNNFLGLIVFRLESFLLITIFVPHSIIENEQKIKTLGIRSGI